MRWYLSVSTYAGIAPGAFHVYGRIRREDGSLQDEVSLEMADGSPGFPTEKSLRHAAVKWWREKASASDVLIAGNLACCDPREILAGPKEMRQEGNRLWREFERLDGWELKENKAEVQRICDKWDALMGRP